MKNYKDILAEHGLTEEELISLLREQVVLMGTIPFENLQYGVNCESTIDESRYPILQKIHPRKRAAVERILDSNIPDSVNKIIVFGSSTGIHCKSTSDLDIAIIGSRKARDERKVPWISTLNLAPKDLIYIEDELYTNSNESNFGGNTIKNGVVVWDREEMQKHI